MINIPMIIHETANSNLSNSNRSQDTPRLNNQVNKYSYTSNRSSRILTAKKENATDYS